MPREKLAAADGRLDDPVDGKGSGHVLASCGLASREARAASAVPDPMFTCEARPKLAEVTTSREPLTETATWRPSAAATLLISP